jgi:hypothetical protein
MSTSPALNIIAICLSGLSLIATAALAFRQAVMMRHGNHVPVLIEFTQQISSAEFQRAEEYLLGQLANDHSSDLGVSGLPEGPRTAATKVVWYSNMLGLLIVLDVVDEPVIIPLLGYRIKRLWGVLEPYIDNRPTLAVPASPLDPQPYPLRGAWSGLSPG